MPDRPMPDEANRVTVRDCIIRTDRLYETGLHLWLRPENDGSVTVGLTDMAQTLAGKILHCTPKPLGLRRPANKPVAILEASKWLGVIRVPFASAIVGSNELAWADASLINQHPYTKGWVVRLQPDRDDWREGLLEGVDAAAVYRENFERWGLVECVHCLGAEV